MQKHPDLPQGFADLGIKVRFLKALANMGFEEPSDTQKGFIPPALEGRDVLGQARTGTGKTAAFGLPVLQQIDPEGRLQGLVLTPTRELAVQVTAELQRIAEFANLHIVPVYGGQKIQTQLHALGKKTHLVVGTPGRVMDFMQRRALDIRDLRFAVLDEVDRMLDIGFRDDIKRILGAIKSEHQTIFVSATLEAEIRRLAMQFMTDPVEVNVSRDKLTVDEIDQKYCAVERHDKFRLLKMFIEQEDPEFTIVFCNTKHIARKLAKKLHDAGIDAKEIHGDLIQAKRDRVMKSFRKHQIRVLVATDLAARGIDVSSISHIVNYDIPPDPQVYVHRIGRTARMGSRGTAVTFVSGEEGKELTQIEKLINREVPHLDVKGFKPSPVPARGGGESGGPREESFLDRFRTEPKKEEPKETVPANRPARPLGGRFKSRRRRRL